MFYYPATKDDAIYVNRDGEVIYKTKESDHLQFDPNDTYAF